MGASKSYTDPNETRDLRAKERTCARESVLLTKGLSGNVVVSETRSICLWLLLTAGEGAQ